MQWREDYATGIAKIDDQHRMIFKMAEDYREALNDGQGASIYSEFLESLDLYAQGHFGFEEDCMLRHHCPAGRQNIAAHQGFVTVLDRFRQGFADDGFSQGVAFELVNTIDLWLAQHICGIDVQLKRFVEPS
ncbi:MAG: hemerythrin family protein [Gemmatimonadales bacterium]